MPKYAIAATCAKTGNTLYWNNDGLPTVWQPTIGEWKFERYVAEEIADSMGRFKMEDVIDVRIKEVPE